MDSAIHYLDPSTVTSVHIDPDAIWIGLNSDTALIPDSVIIFKNLPNPGWSIEDFSDEGRILPMDSARDPDWYRQDEQWAPWTPTSFLLNERPWYDELGTAVPVEERADGWCMAKQQRETCTVDLIRAQECVRGIAEFDDRLSRRAKVPKIFPTSRLAKVHASRKLVQIDAARAKRSVLEAIAFLLWWSSVTLDWDTRVHDAITENVNAFLSTVKSKCGVICDLERDWPRINIPLYIQNKIPFFYIWNFEARVDARFSHLNPALNLTYWATCQGKPLKLTSDIEEEDLSKIARQAIVLDNFFQEVFAYHNPIDPVIHPTYSVFIVDFEGWRCCPINHTTEPVEHLVKLYYYGVFKEDDDECYHTVVFWCWRKRKPDNEYLRRQYKMGLPGEEHATIIRELYKFDYSPTGDTLFHLETGLIVGKAASNDKSTSLLQRIRDDTILATEPERMDESSDFTDDEYDSIRFEPIPDTLYHPRVINSPAAWIRHNNEKLAKARRYAEENHISGGQLAQSQSPIRLTDPYFTAHERPEVMFRRMLKDDAAKITYTESTWCAPDFAWNTDFLEAACLFIPDVESEARLRYWANCWDTITNVRRLLSIAIEHGIKFHLALPPHHVRQFRPKVIDSLDHSSAASLYGTNFQEQSLAVSDNMATFCTAYLARMNDLLRRPHARAFIAEGGQYSWIARCWTGTRLVEEFMSGPSIQVTVHNHGFYDSASEDASYLSHDSVSDQEKDALLGYCPGVQGCAGRWLFPPADVFEEKFSLWTGEWNAALDHCYRRLADTIIRGKGRLRTREKWRDWIRSNERGQRRPAYLPSVDDFNSVMEGIALAGLRRTWHKMPLEDIAIPEQRED